MGSGPTHTPELPPLKQIMQGLIYLGKHRAPRKTANHFPGESENLKGEREAIPGLSIRSTAQCRSLPQRFGGCLRHPSPDAMVWAWPWAGKALLELFLLPRGRHLAHGVTLQNRISWFPRALTHPQPLPFQGKSASTSSGWPPRTDAVPRHPYDCFTRS